MGKERFATVSIGRGFLVYDLEKVTVRVVSPMVLKEKISALACSKERTFTACGRDVFEWQRTKVKRQVVDGAKLDTGAVVALKIFGKVLVVACRGATDDAPGELLLVSMVSGQVTKRLCLGASAARREGKPATKRKQHRIMVAATEEHTAAYEDAAFTPTCLLHPDTYLNKMVVASSKGTMELWNVRTGKCIYGFKGFGSSVLCLEQSTALDVVGAGLADGRVVLHNLRLDTTLFTFEHKGGSVTSLSFRTDSQGPSGPLFPTMVSGNAAGELAVWDLQEKRLAFTVRDAHDGAVTKVSFLAGEPLLVTAGIDNALKIYIFDQDDGSCRLLKSRQGHKAPPTKIRYYGGDTVSTLASGADAAVCQILSAGRDRAFRLFHTAREQLNRELSQGPLLKRARTLDVKVEELKLPPIVDFCATEARHRDWCNVISVHNGESAAFVWQLENRVIGTKVLRPDGGSGDLTLRKLNTDNITKRAGTFPPALCVTISICGNFGIVGTADGSIHKYNMQSGLPRGSFPAPSSEHLSKETLRANRKKRRRLDPSNVALLPGLGEDSTSDKSDPRLLQHHPDKHRGPVFGVAVDSLNKTLASAGFDGTIKFWDFTEHSLLGSLSLDAPVAHMVANRDAGLLALACDDMQVRVVDMSTRRVIRTFAGHDARITDLAFSRDARWLASASVDTSLRIWDLPTARCIDWLEFERPVTGLSFAPTGEFLATSFADSVGISLWANKCYFGAAKADRIARKPVLMELPSPAAGSTAAMVEAPRREDDADDNDDSDDEDAAETVPDTDFAGEICLSGDTVSKWSTLAHLDLIKQRNKPIEPPKKPEKAPFFLPTSQSVNPVFKRSKDADGKADQEDGEEEEESPAVFAQAGDWGDEDDADAQAEAGEQQDADADDQGGAEFQSSRILGNAGFARPRSELFRLLEACHAKQDFAPVLEHLMALSPSAIDFELQSVSLGPEDDDGGGLLRLLLEWIHLELKRKTNFEVVQALLHRVLVVHHDSCSQRPELHALLCEIRSAQDTAWKALRGMLQHNLCLLSFFAHQV
ncbi:WD repeat-containing protein 36 (T-cell activation WD repeat-containing protein) (TA-WDRP) [Durusdinium trenchii]|uniref:WD repeat-containing protein 36 (T-cell activation WD repeat-containing protein) (TA-WDRP) n=1 Tax=Durusdinium trenchii TaxID=1381693 RepID=A0ABP0SBA2_9DINO